MNFIDILRGKFNDVADLESKFDSSVCAFIVETIQGEGGIYPVSSEFWNRVRSLANQHDAAFIADDLAKWRQLIPAMGIPPNRAPPLLPRR